MIQVILEIMWTTIQTYSCHTNSTIKIKFWLENFLLVKSGTDINEFSCTSIFVYKNTINQFKKYIHNYLTSIYLTISNDILSCDHILENILLAIVN